MLFRGVDLCHWPLYIEIYKPLNRVVIKTDQYFIPGGTVYVIQMLFRGVDLCPWPLYIEIYKPLNRVIPLTTYALYT